MYTFHLICQKVNSIIPENTIAALAKMILRVDLALRDALL